MKKPVMAAYPIGTTILMEDTCRFVYDIVFSDAEPVYHTYPLGVKERIERVPDMANHCVFNEMYRRSYTESEITRQTIPTPIRVPTQMGTVVAEVIKHNGLPSMIVTSLELPDGSKQVLSEVYGLGHKNRLNINVLDGNGHDIHKATYTAKSLHIQKEE